MKDQTGERFGRLPGLLPGREERLPLDPQASLEVAKEGADLRKFGVCARHNRAGEQLAEPSFDRMAHDW